jgi:hypothetical protein
LKKVPSEVLRDPHSAVYAALLYDDDNQTATADGYLKLAESGHLYPEEKQLLEEIAIRRQTASPTPAQSNPAPSNQPREGATTPAPTASDSHAHP